MWALGLRSLAKVGMGEAPIELRGDALQGQPTNALLILKDLRENTSLSRGFYI
jgi:hypothetical protein